MDLLAEVEVRGHRVLEEVDAEVPEQHEEVGVLDVGGLGKHPDEGGRQHEPCPGRDEVTEPGVPPPMGRCH